MALKNNTWTLNNWYDQDVAGNVSYSATGDSSTLWSWGYNWQGALGHNEGGQPGTVYSSPVQIPGTIWGSGLIGGAVTSLDGTGIKTDGTLWVWGHGASGGLGLNDRTQRSSPTQVPGTTWSKTAMGYFIQYGIKTDGTLWSWGYNSYGELGQNNTTKYSSPAQIPGTTWSDVTAYGEGSRGALAIRTDGTLWAWGSGSYGALGQNQSGANAHRSSPVQIPGTTWSKFGVAKQAVLAIKTDGTLWGWGHNLYGLLGINTSHPGQSYVSSPTQVGSDTDWSNVRSGHYHTLAIKTNGTMYGWGYNWYGQLGHNTNGYHISSPVQVPGTTWSKAWGGEFSSLAMKTDGTIWGMGRNFYGELGQNNRSAYSSPTQIGSDTGWIDGYMSESQGFFFKE